ncbi:MAG: SWIM zinc finger family protein [Collinsella sp.]
MAQGTFVQALRKEAALSGTFMKGRSLMLNGAVLSIEDNGSRFSKNVTVEGSVRGSRGDLYKTHVALDMDEHEVIDYDCDCPAAYRYPGMCKHAIATALAYLDASGIEPVEGLRTPVRTFTAAPKQAVRPASAAPAVNPNFPSRRQFPRARAS